MQFRSSFSMIRERIAIIDKYKCKNKIDCPFLCGQLCPINRAGKHCIIEDADDGRALIVEELCIGCGICIKQCPHLAITIVNLPKELSHLPVHRYGRNMFELFSVPLPKPRTVLGLLGVNGIGKSTAIKILGKQFIPNLSDFNAVPSYEAVLEYYKGKEEKHLFKKLSSDEMTVAFKPQEVTLISKSYNGTVRSLLKKCDTAGKIDEITDRLEISHIMERDIKKVSGGELQRIAIAATVLKDADLYIFDEPSSYLDIKQRLNVGTFIKKLGEEKSVIVVEHDLLIMDYMTDSVQIMFGKHGVFGVVSNPLQARNAINSYLTGYLKEENIRFRNTKITFEERTPQDRQIKRDTLISWDNLTKKFSQFSLEANNGMIKKGDIIGIFGENGIGKTTFVKILANVLKADQGSIKGNIAVSYKPQYLDIDNYSNMLVSEYLHEVIAVYDKEIIQPMNIKPLFLKTLSQLSGGELQRVAIAGCLGRDADIYLLDEPSAYLDIEQRLFISKIIRDFIAETDKACIVVDHDIVFIDYLANKLLLFEGNPGRNGKASGPYPMIKGMNNFLKNMNITVRRDPESKRPRINKPDSVKDREQRSSGNYYYQ